MFRRAVTDDPDGDEQRIAQGDPLPRSRTLFRFSRADRATKGASAEPAVARALPIVVRRVEEF